MTSSKIPTPMRQTEPPSAIALRVRRLQDRHGLPPAVAGVIAELMLTPSPSWLARRT